MLSLTRLHAEVLHFALLLVHPMGSSAPAWLLAFPQGCVSRSSEALGMKKSSPVSQANLAGCPW